MSTLGETTVSDLPYSVLDDVRLLSSIVNMKKEELVQILLKLGKWEEGKHNLSKPEIVRLVREEFTRAKAAGERNISKPVAHYGTKYDNEGKEIPRTKTQQNRRKYYDKNVEEIRQKGLLSYYTNKIKELQKESVVSAPEILQDKTEVPLPQQP